MVQGADLSQKNHHIHRLPVIAMWGFGIRAYRNYDYGSRWDGLASVIMSSWGNDTRVLAYSIQAKCLQAMLLNMLPSSDQLKSNTVLLTGLVFSAWPGRVPARQWQAHFKACGLQTGAPGGFFAMPELATKPLKSVVQSGILFQKLCVPTVEMLASDLPR